MLAPCRAFLPLWLAACPPAWRTAWSDSDLAHLSEKGGLSTAPEEEYSLQKPRSQLKCATGYGRQDNGIRTEDRLIAWADHAVTCSISVTIFAQAKRSLSA